jgi:Protein of unknown function (DUF3617)
MKNYMKFTKSHVGLAIALALTALPALANIKEMPPGLWEIKSTMDIPGMPPEMAAKMAGGMTLKQCIKPGEGKWNEQRAPMERGQRKCEPVDMKTSGNTVSWKLKCADGTNGEGKVTHNGKDAYKMEMNMTSPRGSMKMTSEGKKIADVCEK